MRHPLRVLLTSIFFTRMSNITHITNPETLKYWADVQMGLTSWGEGTSLATLLVMVSQ